MNLCDPCPFGGNRSFKNGQNVIFYFVDMFISVLSLRFSSCFFIKRSRIFICAFSCFSHSIDFSLTINFYNSLLFASLYFPPGILYVLQISSIFFHRTFSGFSRKSR
uniref:Uncharacterized protein n=1 Tax=Leptospirillum ferrodiazotrophum TaxID=412449 RepID=C6HV68_9BACT|nr:MAG: hypothetical protein UBAL3_78920032 [Leptospirillum ferrodiazotrophum]